MPARLQWPSALSRALRTDQQALTTPPSLSRRAFSSRTTSTRVQTPWRSQSPQWTSTSGTLPPFAQNRRKFSSTPIPRHNHLDPPKPGEERHVTFITKEGTSHTFAVADGDNLLDIAQDNDLEMEGACGGSCACSTCHVIVESEDMYNKMEEPDDDENDMLDLAFGLQETSRLGCQVKMSRELDGLVVRLPSMTRNLQASDFETK
ncbi:2fe-2s iron-sulfur cluster binding domain protein [Paraphaeosphaeria sporulosa]